MPVADLKRSEKKYHSDVEEFLPYACHYDDETILTKNGELMQVIKITGFNFETIKEDGQEDISIREVVRDTIKNNIKTGDYAIWLHTIRRKIDISAEGEYEEGFAKNLNHEWSVRNSWNNQFVNELYISVIISGEALSIINPKIFFETLLISTEFRKREQALKRAVEKLDTTVNKIIDGLQEYGAKKLSTFKNRGKYYSEIMSFCSKLMNLKQIDIPLKTEDISKTVPVSQASFQFNTVKVRGKKANNYGAVFTIKEYLEVAASEIDKFLQLPIQFIISESFDFVGKKQALKDFEAQEDIFRLSGNNKLQEATGFKEVIEGDEESETDYGEHEIIITILEEDLKNMNYSVSLAVDSLREMGVVFIREDLYMEDCYWSQIPANFDFLKRKSYIRASKIGGYASLYNYPAGKMKDNHWGSAVTVFRTEKNTPYFFNFHFEDNGHTTIIGPYGTGKTVLQNFLVSEAQKYKPKTFYFEVDRGSEIFINAIGGKYINVFSDIANKKLKLNPLKLKDTEENRKFLEEWFEYLIEFTAAKTYQKISEEDQQKIKQAVDLNYSLPVEQRKLSIIVPQIWSDFESETAKKLANWHHNGPFAACFDNDEDNNTIIEDHIVGFDLTKIIENQAVKIPLMSYFLHLVEQSITKDEPDIIVIDQAWKLIDNPAFTPKLDAWLEKLKSKNAICIFATEAVEVAQSSAITSNLIKNIKTQIFLPNRNANKRYREVFGLTKQEYKYVKNISPEERQFLLKHNTDSVVCRLNLRGLNKELSVLSSFPKNIEYMKVTKEKIGKEPKNWLPKYFKLLGFDE